MMVAEHLRTKGYRVIEAATTNEAAAVLSSVEHIDIGVSDVNLSGGGPQPRRCSSNPIARLVEIAHDELGIGIAFRLGIGKQQCERLAARFVCAGSGTSLRHAVVPYGPRIRLCG